MSGDLETAAAGIGAAFGTGSVSPTLAAALRSLLPEALFLRASLRCGAGLFVSEDLLQPGQNELSVASLKNSLAGLAMAQQHPVVVAASAATAAPAAAQVVCVPVALSPSNADAAAAQAAVVAAAQQAAASGGSPSASGGQGQGGPAACRPVYVGALMLGSPHTGGLPAGLTQALQALAAAAAPYLLLLGLTTAADMADLLRLRAADCICCGGEEDELQDLPLEACRPQLSPRSSGGSAGGAASHFSDLAGSEQDSPAAQVDAAALNAAAAKALAGASNLAPPPAEAAAARASGGSSRGQRPAAAALRQRGPEQRQGKQAAGEGKAGAEAEADPKAALRRLQAATPAEAAPPPHVPTGPLLDFSDAELEARFAAAHSRSQLCGDALFCVLQLAGALTLAVLDPDALRSGTGAALTLALALPLVAMAADTDRYLRSREAMLSLVLLLVAGLLRSTAAAALLRLRPAGTATRLPWLLRCTGAEALALFSIGFKLRFRRFLPIHILCLALVLGGLPARCRSAAAADGCLPATLHRAAVAALLCLGGLLPAVAHYKTEGQARRRFMAASRPLFGLPRQPAAATAE